ncbi:recombinase family protein [Nocardia iowensis]|uniref:Recombinase family protein n=1 Tax=Nocardia iowensis TaxID=204891 RepID=A0ABX8RSF6_NOCIO|nr:recombinase family protein [Nocardia iowensis]QXN92549.1 recombinase family protein [Nocardia iowensis]
MIYGYARAAHPWDLTVEVVSLRRSGCDEVFHDAYTEDDPREDWAHLIERVQPGDTIRFVEFDRVARDPDEAGFILDGLTELGVHSEFLVGRY